MQEYCRHLIHIHMKFCILGTGVRLYIVIKDSALRTKEMPYRFPRSIIHQWMVQRYSKSIHQMNPESPYVNHGNISQDAMS